MESHQATLRRLVVGLVAALVASLVAVAPAAAQPGVFDDVVDDAYYSVPVAALAEDGVFAGTECDDSGFCPSDSLDRQTMAVWTVRVLDGADPAAVSTTRFSDVKADSFFAPFIERMAELGVTTGCGDGTRFCPDGTVTRAQMAVFLTRAFSLAPGPDPGFTDVPADAWYFDQLTALAASGITKGCDDGTRFCPERDTTRAQMATFLWRAEKLGNDTPTHLGDFDLDRLLEAADTLDIEADCPDAAIPETLEDMAEVLLIVDGCLIIEYEPLTGRSIAEVRAEVLAENPTAHAVGLPPTGLQIDSFQTAPYDLDQYGTAESLHLWALDAAQLWDPEGWKYTDSRGRERQAPGWHDDTEVVVAVLDTGVSAHRDLSTNLIPSSDASTPWLEESCHRNPSHGHGTHVAGLIAAKQGNSLDVAGIAPKAKILPIRLIHGAGACDSLYGESTSATNAVYHAVRAGTRVINMSFRWGYEEGTRTVAGVSQSYDTFEAALLAVKRSHNVVAITSAGNCGDPGNQSECSAWNERRYPKVYPHVITVAATTVAATARGVMRAPFSNVNQDVDISAPGDGLMPYSGISSTWLNNKTYKTQGTSMAAPLVSGVVAHMIARYPQATPDQITQALYETAVHPQTGNVGGPRTHEYGWGFMDPVAAIQALDQVMWPHPITGPARYAEPFSILAAGAIHTCALSDDDTVACWGDNEHGQTDAPSGAFGAVSAGRSHSCGLRTDGTLACWGLNDRGQASPPPVSNFKGVTSGGGHSCALRDDGTVACWGDDDQRQTEAPAGRFIAVSAGGDQSCAVRASGTVVCWGDPGSLQSPRIHGRYNAVSSGTAHSCGLRTDDTIRCWSGGLLGDSREVVTDVPGGTFTAVSAHGNNACGLRNTGNIACWGEQLEGEVQGPFTAVTVGLFHMCATRPNGSVECRGNNNYGQTDVPSLSGEPQPEATSNTQPAATGFSAVSAGQFHSCALRTNGTIQCWGNNDDGQTDAPDGTFNAVTAGGVHSCALRTNSTIQCWGNNDDGQTDAPDGTFNAVTAGRGHSCALGTNGTIQCWGNNYSGKADAPDGTFSAVTAGGVHSCALRTNSTIQCWGYNFDGQTDAPDGTFSAVSAGTFHSCALRTNGTIQCWGGDGSADAPAATFSAVAAGSHSCGLRTNGTIQCWGDDYSNYSGQIDAPEGSFNAVSAGREHSCGLRTDGSIQCWGDNRHGQTDTPQPGS